MRDQVRLSRRLMLLLACAAVAFSASSFRGGAAVSAEVRNPSGIAVIVGNKAYRHERVPECPRANLGIEKLRFLCRLAQDLRYLDRRATSTRRDVWTRLGAGSGPGARRIVPKKETDLFDRIASFPALHGVCERRAVFVRNDADSSII